jgi:hypothetical protein
MAQYQYRVQRLVELDLTVLTTPTDASTWEDHLNPTSSWGSTVRRFSLIAHSANPQLTPQHMLV